VTPEQRDLLARAGPVRPSGDQTPEQAFEVAVHGFRWACQLAGFDDPLPDPATVRAALVRL
jgi:hypothetical protein